MGKAFLSMMQNSEHTIEKIDRFAYIKVENIYRACQPRKEFTENLNKQMVIWAIRIAIWETQIQIET